MSASTRSSGASTGICCVVAAALAGCAPLCAATTPVAPPLPALVEDAAPGLRPQGGGEMAFLGMPVYDGFYWSAARGFSLDRPFALDLHYKRRFDGRRIAERSVEEIARLGYGSATERQRWGEAMARIFPDVARGDRLTGLHVPGEAVRYFHNGRPIGAIDAPGFAQAFFAIWLDPRTSRADFRARLLGEP